MNFKRDKFSSGFVLVWLVWMGLDNVPGCFAT